MAATTSPVLRPSRIGQPLAEPRVIADLVPKGERGGRRPGGVVIVGRWEAEHGHHRVADELLQRPAVMRHDLPGDPK